MIDDQIDLTQEVVFHLRAPKDRKIMKSRRDDTWVIRDYVAVSLSSLRPPRVLAMGETCDEDGIPLAYSFSDTIELSEKQQRFWIKKAKAVLARRDVQMKEQQ